MTSSRPSDAHVVASSLLDTTGLAMLRGDAQTFADCFSLPVALATVDSVRRLESHADVVEAFHEVTAHYKRLGVARVDRDPQVALYDGPDVIRHAHVTRLLGAENHPVSDTFLTLSRLERVSGAWRIAECCYHVPRETDHGLALMRQGRDLPPRDASEVATATMVLQGVLDRVTQAYLQLDFERLRDRVHLPLFVQGSLTTVVHQTYASLEEEFRRYTTLFQVHNVTDVVRRVTSAERIGPNRIFGSYRTHILSGTQLVIPAYKSAVILEQGSNLQWRMTSVVHPMGYLTLETAPTRGKE